MQETIDDCMEHNVGSIVTWTKIAIFTTSLPTIAFEVSKSFSTDPVIGIKEVKIIMLTG